jgi:hypothetical protein
METTTSAKSVESIGTTLRNVQNPTTVQKSMETTLTA